MRDQLHRVIEEQFLESSHTCCNIGRNDILGVWGRRSRGAEVEGEAKSCWSQTGILRLGGTSRKLRHCPFSFTRPFLWDIWIISYVFTLFLILSLQCFALCDDRGHVANAYSAYSPSPEPSRAPHHSRRRLSSIIQQTTVRQGRRPMIRPYAACSTPSRSGMSTPSNAPQRSPDELG